MRARRIYMIRGRSIIGDSGQTKMGVLLCRKEPIHGAKNSHDTRQTTTFIKNPGYLHSSQWIFPKEWIFLKLKTG